MERLDFDALDETEFEEFCFVLLNDLGFVNVGWRKGTGLNASPADRGRDIEADLERYEVDGARHVEKWFVDCSTTSVEFRPRRFTVCSHGRTPNGRTSH